MPKITKKAVPFGPAARGAHKSNPTASGEAHATRHFSKALHAVMHPSNHAYKT